MTHQGQLVVSNLGPAAILPRKFAIAVEIDAGKVCSAVPVVVNVVRTHGIGAFLG